MSKDSIASYKRYLIAYRLKLLNCIQGTAGYLSMSYSNKHISLDFQEIDAMRRLYRERSVDAILIFPQDRALLK